MAITIKLRPTDNPVNQRFLNHCHRRRYPNKSEIIYAGDPPDALYYITNGSVAVVNEDDEGREIVLAYLNAGDIFGEMGLYQSAAHRRAWERARTQLDLAKEPDAMTHPDGMQIRITRQELGRIVGCSREMVGRVLKNLEQLNLISAKGKTIVVHGARCSALHATILHSGARRSALAHRAQAHTTVGLSGSSLGLTPLVG